MGVPEAQRLRSDGVQPVPGIGAAPFVTFSVLLAVFVFVFLALGALLEQTGPTRVGGYFGLAAAAGAWYTSAAGVLSTTFGRVVLPTGPR
ncbi:GPR1/FUN34/YaaH family transporter [Rhodococcus sp. GA1]|uniref:GPR1/FUN34/YaaH family transporter n=1 Tax=Rhodococcus sp. GA1 TaxID=2942275 RepID=UPI0020CE24E2|nr:GPR1/FUN34/YaaH family transporter [Rhodococcus sp. GA1]